MSLRMEDRADDIIQEGQENYHPSWHGQSADNAEHLKVPVTPSEIKVEKV
jgi:hypothetical protein